MFGFSNQLLIFVAIGGICIGTLFLVRGGGYIIGAVSEIAERWGLSKFFLSATIVAFGTSAPELFISINANLSGLPGLSIGSVVGSNIANILLVVGISSLVAPILINRAKIRWDVLFLAIATVILAFGMLTTNFSRELGLLMFLLFVAYLINEFRNNRVWEHKASATVGGRSNSKLFFSLFGGFVVLIAGSELLVYGAVAAGHVLGVREAIIGMTVVALGTSISELATCIVAARRKETEIVVGGVVGSNIFNILSVIGLTALISPLPVAPSFLEFDLFAVIGVTSMFALLLLLASRISRNVGIVFVICYLGFVLMQYRDLLVN